MTVAVITARGGSTRIPKKNIKAFAGRPIIGYVIETVFRTELFERVVVSTDSDEIAKVARSYGAETPFVRPAELSDNHTPTAPVLSHALQWLGERDGPSKYALCIYPTAVFARAEDIVKGYEMIRNHGASVVFPVTTYSFPIFRSHRIRPDGLLEMIWPEYETTRSQDLPEAVHDAGQYWWLNVQSFLESGRIYMDHALPIKVPRYLAQDIDTPEDWEVAERLFKTFRNRDGFVEED